MDAISSSDRKLPGLITARVCLVVLIGLACFWRVNAQTDRAGAHSYSNYLYADANYVSLDFLDSYLQLTTLNLGVDRLRQVKNWRLGFSYGITVSHLQASSTTLWGVGCAFTALADVHFFAKVGMSLSPVFGPPPQEFGDSEFLLIPLLPSPQPF